MCVRHMYNNFKKLHDDLALKERIQAFARAPYKNLFKALMEALKATDERAFQWRLDNTTRNNGLEHTSEPLLNMTFY